MYKCEICKKTSSKNEPQSKLITKYRNQKYYDNKGNLVSTGNEIVSSINVCMKCYRNSLDTTNK